MENASEGDTFEDFNLNEDEQATMEIFLACLDMKYGFSHAYYELDTLAVKEFCKEHEMLFSYVYTVCKRLLPIENKKLNKEQ